MERLRSSSCSSPALQGEKITTCEQNISNIAPETESQRYKYFCIVDLEASINKSDGSHEITEFPLILLSAATPSLELVEEFHTFIRPQRNKHSEVSDHITNESPAFPEAWQHILSFLDRHGITDSNTLAITCGDWDFRAMLPAELSFHKIGSLLLFEKWCNIKHAFKSFTGKKADSMVRMLNVIGEELVGTHHSGIDDSRNIATIARSLAQQGHVFRVTSDGSIDEATYRRQEALKLEKEEAKRSDEAARIVKLEAGKTRPQDMFKNDSSFSEWDEDGIPMRLADGTAVSKSAINKRKKLWKAQQILHEKYLAWRVT